MSLEIRSDRLTQLGFLVAGDDEPPANQENGTYQTAAAAQRTQHIAGLIEQPTHAGRNQ